jgi:putative photosynthetic complex assembly protein 2
MVSWSGHILPLIATGAVWFLATGLIAWLDNRDRSTFPRSLALAGAAGIIGLGMIFVSMHFTSIAAIYASFAGAILVWSWHEIGFLTGATAGPRREPCPPGAKGWERFSQASATLMHHEIALALTALMLVTLTWLAPNQIAAMTFLLLYVLRLSAKLNIFIGVPNTHTDILPAHLAYLKSYYGANRLSLALPASMAGFAGLAALLGMRAFGSEAGSSEAVGASLLFTLTVLGIIEHLFLALPFRDGAIWGWALPRKARAVARPRNAARGDLAMEEES